jgi:hypothetical protein
VANAPNIFYCALSGKVPRFVQHSNAMKTTAVRITVALCATLCLAAFAQDSKKPASAEKPTELPTKTKPAKPKLTPEELEAKFKATLTKATLSGRWCSLKEGQLGPEKEDKYTIIGVNKVGGDVWMINARIQYAKKDITAPIPVQVKWAGDTPVIIVDDVGVPGSGTYSARVMIYENTYAGTWSGGDHGGLMNGVITQQKE